MSETKIVTIQAGQGSLTNLEEGDALGVMALTRHEATNRQSESYEPWNGSQKAMEL